MKNTPLRKSFGAAALKADIQDNCLRVVASTTGNPDRVGDVIFPGAFKSVSKTFLSDGFIAIGHDWDDLPVAMPTSCEEKGGELICEAEFHSTAEAQAARTVCLERMAAGKSVSLSIGFMPDYDAGVQWFQSGKDLLKYAEAEGYNLDQFDTAAIKKLGMCRGITKVNELFEFSIVTVGMNRRAKAVDVKSLSGECGLLADLPLAEHLDTVLAAGEAIASRMADYKAMRQEDERPMSPDRIAQLKRLGELVGAILEGAASEPTQSEPDADEADAKFRELEFRSLSHRTRMAG